MTKSIKAEEFDRIFDEGGRGHCRLPGPFHRSSSQPRHRPAARERGLPRVDDRRAGPRGQARGHQPPGGHQDLDRRAHRPHARLPLGVGAPSEPRWTEAAFRWGARHARARPGCYAGGCDQIANSIRCIPAWRRCYAFRVRSRQKRPQPRKHGIDFEQAKRLWDGKVVTVPSRGEYGELRYVALGMIDGKHWTAVFTRRGERTRIILGSTLACEGGCNLR